MMRMFQEEEVDINLMDNKINNALSLSLSLCRYYQGITIKLKLTQSHTEQKKSRN